MTSEALRALARELAPLIARELGLPEPGAPPVSGGRYDRAACVGFVSPLHLGDTVLIRARAFFERLAESGRVGSLELVQLLDLKGATSIPANLTNPLKKRAARMGLPLPWDEDADRENRTVWLDRDGNARRLLHAIDEEIARRALTVTKAKSSVRPDGR